MPVVDLLLRNIFPSMATPLPTHADSTIHLARAAALSPTGRVISLEYDARHASVATQNITNSGLSHLVDIRVGDARQLVGKLQDEKQVFDIVFIDADKECECSFTQMRRAG